MTTEQQVLGQIELMRNQGAELSPEQWQAVEQQLRQGYNPQGGLEQGKPAYDRWGNFVGFQTEGAGRLPPTFGMEMPPEQFSAELETMQRADLGIPQARLRYYAEEQAQARQGLGKWEKNLKKELPIDLWDLYRKGGKTPETRLEALNKEIKKRQEEWEEATPQVKFAALQKQGLIPEGAILDHIDEKGQVWYIPAGQTVDIGVIKSQFLAESDDNKLKYMEASGGSGLAFGALLGAGLKPDEVFDSLAKERQEQILVYYASRGGKTPTFEEAIAGSPIPAMEGFFFLPAGKWMAGQKITGLDWGIGAAQLALWGIGPATGAARAVGGAVTGRVVSGTIQGAAGGLFTAETIRQWDKMNNMERTIAVAIDTLLIGGALKSFKGVNLGEGKVEAVLDQARAKERATLKAVAPREVVRAYDPYVKAADGYAKNLSEIKAAQRLIKTRPGGPLAEDFVTLQEARGATAKLRYELIQTGNEFARVQKTAGPKPRGFEKEVGKAGIESTETIEPLGQRTAEDIKSTVDQVFSEKIPNIKSLNRQIKNLQTEIKIAQHDQDFKRVINLQHDLSDLNYKLRIAKSGELMKLTVKRAQVMDEITRVEAQRQSARTAEARQKFNNQLTNLRGKDFKLEKQATESLKNFEVEWGETLRRGGGRTLVQAPREPFPYRGGGGGGKNVYYKDWWERQREVEEEARLRERGQIDRLADYLEWERVQKSPESVPIKWPRPRQFKGAVEAPPRPKVIPIPKPITKPEEEPKKQPEVVPMPQPKPSPQPQPTPSPTPTPTPTTTPKPSPAPSPAPAAAPMPQPVPTPQPQPQPRPQPSPTPTPVPAPKPSPYPQPAPKPQPKPGGRGPKSPPKTTAPPKRPAALLKQLKQEKKEFLPTPEEIHNAVALKAGIGWWLRFQNGKFKFYKELPEGVQNVKPGKGSGYRSAQTFQGKPVEDEFQMGIVRVKLHRPSKEPGRPGSCKLRANWSQTTENERHQRRPGLPNQGCRVKSAIAEGQNPRGSSMKLLPVLKFCGMVFGPASFYTAISVNAQYNYASIAPSIAMPSNLNSFNLMSWTITGGTAYWIVQSIQEFFLFASLGFLAWLWTEIIEAKAEELGLK